MSKMRRTLADSVGGTRKTRVNAASSSRVTTPSAIANLAPSAMTAMVQATPGSSGLAPAMAPSRSNRRWPAKAPASAPSGPPPSRNPAAAPPNFPQMDMGEANKPILAQLRRAAMTQWKFYIDRGGTFTDVVAEAPDGTLSSLKLLSESPNYDDAALEAIRRTLNVDANAPLPADLIAEVRMGNDGSDQCAAHARRRAHSTRHHEGIARPASYRHAAPAKIVRAEHRIARHTL